MKDLIMEDLVILKRSIDVEQVYEHIIASILEIYTRKLPYNQVFEQITKEIKNINEPENADAWGAVYSLTKIISGSDPLIKYFYQEEIPENEELWVREIAGEIYDYIYQNG